MNIAKLSDEGESHLTMSPGERFKQALAAFDEYNANDPHQEEWEGKWYPKEVLYAQRMSEQLSRYAPDAAEHIRLAARCQHIGRWEIPREQYPMDRKGYLQWRTVLKSLHATIAGKILLRCGYDNDTISNVTFILLKKELFSHPDTQLLEDVICLVFVAHYLEAFAARHDDDKVMNILRKTIKKMSTRAIHSVGQLPLSEKTKELIQRAIASC